MLQFFMIKKNQWGFNLFFCPESSQAYSQWNSEMPAILPINFATTLCWDDYNGKRIFEKENCNINCEIDMKRKYSIMQFQVHKVTVNVNYLPWKTSNIFKA